jgi:hypothetical protein
VAVDRMVAQGNHSRLRSQRGCMPILREEQAVVQDGCLDNWSHVQGKDRHIQQMCVGSVDCNRWMILSNHQARVLFLVKPSFQPKLQ